MTDLLACLLRWRNLSTPLVDFPFGKLSIGVEISGVEKRKPVGFLREDLL